MLSLRTSPIVPVSVITGFLGSGKTTLLNHLLAHRRFRKTAVIINEFGDIGLDHLLVEQIDERMVLLNSGCICCSVRGDLIETVSNLFAQRARNRIPRFDRIAIETTGLAEPAPVLQAVSHVGRTRKNLHLDSVIAVLDAICGEQTLELHAEAVGQVAAADVLVLSKSDLVGDTSELHERARLLNPAARWMTSQAIARDPRRLWGGKATKRADSRATSWNTVDDSAKEHRDPHLGTDTFVIRRPGEMDFATFELFRETLMSYKSDELLRVKGIVNLAGHPVVLHGVQHVMSPPHHLKKWPTNDRDSRVVFIARGITKTDVEGLLDALARTARFTWKSRLRQVPHAETSAH